MPQHRLNVVNADDNTMKKPQTPETASLATSSTLVEKKEADDTYSLASTSTDATKLAPPVPSTTQPAGSSSTKDARSSWRDKLRRSQAEEPGKEKWRDASLNEKERWKAWQKAKDKEQKKNSTAGFYTEQYKGKGKTGYWLDVLF